MDILLIILFFWLLGKAAGLALRLTWGLTKIVAGILLVLALPVLVLCLIVAGGIALLVPLALVAIAWGILKNA